MQAWTLNVTISHPGWLNPILKTLRFNGDLDDVLAQFKRDNVRDCDLFNLRQNKNTAFKDANGVTHRWRLEEDAPASAS